MLVTLWDTIGQETHGPIPKRFYIGADGILLVYDITKEGKGIINSLKIKINWVLFIELIGK